MSRITLGTALVVILGALVLYAYIREPDPLMMSRPDQEAAANNPSVQIETRTQPDETVPPVVAPDADPVLGDTDSVSREDADLALLTVDGYDAERVRRFLNEVDMSVATRNAYLQRLERAYGDAPQMAEVLDDLRDALRLDVN